MLTELVHHVGEVGAMLAVSSDFPQPTSSRPPGYEGLNTILSWLMWLVTAAAVAGLFFTAARMAMSHRRGDDSHVGQLGWILAGCILAGSAAGIVNALI
jgi:hypothetical protein